MATDLTPGVQRLGAILRAIPDEALGSPTPCSESSVGDLIDHVDSFAVAFTAAARKQNIGGRPPAPDRANLGDHWRTRIPARLAELAEAWQDPAAWEGMTTAGGLDLPGEVAGAVAADELVLHGWDLAVATGQPYDVDPDLLEAAHGFVQAVVDEGGPRDGLFGPPVEVPDDASLFDRVLGLAGRDPGWRP
jgi:uncharacterized protein (TIGR03086 family)